MQVRHQSSLFRLVVLCAVGTIGVASTAHAQITPTIAGDPGATGTIVTPTGTILDITGGQTAGNNLFHSFSQFGLDSGQTANFQTAAEIQNVLARINGGNPSVIDGLLKLSGSNANLYLMNPAGVVFGLNASLNLPASFVVTTSPHIGIQGSDGIAYSEFNAIGNNNYATLAGIPYRFRFPTGATGSIINSANLTGLQAQSPETIANLTGYIPTLKPNAATGLKSGGHNAIAFIANTVFSPSPIFTSGANVVGVATTENSTVVFEGDPLTNTTVGNPIKATIVTPDNTNNAAIASTPFNAFVVPSLADLISSNQSKIFDSFDTTDSSSVIRVANNQVTYEVNATKFFSSSLSTTIQSGDLVISRIYNHNAEVTTPNQGNVLLKASGNIATSDVYGGDLQSVRLDAGKGIQNRSYISGGDVKITANGDIMTGGVISRSGDLQLRSTGAATVKSLLALIPDGISPTSAAGNIDVQAKTLKVTGYTSIPLGWVQSDAVIVPEVLTNPVSIAATGNIKIQQENAGFVEAVNLKRDESGRVVYGLTPDLARRVSIAGVNATDGQLLVTDLATGEQLTTTRVFAQILGREFSTGGTAGLIARLDHKNGSPVELSGVAIPPNNTTINLVGPPIATLPNSVLSQSPVVETAVTRNSSAPTLPPSVVLDYSPTLSGAAIRGNSPINLGLLKVELAPPEEGILTIIRQASTQISQPPKR